MNQLTPIASAFDATKLPFVTMIKTDIVKKDGTQECIVTLLTDFMWEETVTGLNKALKCGDKAISWQTSVYALNGAKPRLFVQYPKRFAV